MSEKGINRQFLEEFAKQNGITNPEDIDNYVTQMVLMMVFA